MAAPVHVYYRLDDYYQNHKKYVQSVVYAQLHGKNVSRSSLGDCDTMQTVDLERLNASTADALPNNGVINPCGLQAWSYFNDTFSGFTINAGVLPVDDSELVWASDRETFFGDYVAENLNTVPGLEGGGALDSKVSQSEHFMEWMKLAAQPGVGRRAPLCRAAAGRRHACDVVQQLNAARGADVVKFWGTINRDLDAGDLVTVQIDNRYNTYGYGGAKWVILSTAGPFGSRAPAFGIIWLAAALIWGVATVVSGVLGVRKGHGAKRSDADKLAWLRSRLSWNQGKQRHVSESLARPVRFGSSPRPAPALPVTAQASLERPGLPGGIQLQLGRGGAYVANQ